MLEKIAKILEDESKKHLLEKLVNKLSSRETKIPINQEVSFTIGKTIFKGKILSYNWESNNYTISYGENKTIVRNYNKIWIGENKETFCVPCKFELRKGGL